MAGSKTNYFEDAVLNVLRGTGITAVTPRIALFTAVTDGETSTITEVTNANAYARTAVTFGAPSGGSMSNSAQVLFPTPTGAGWGTIVGWGVVDSATHAGGNILYYSDQTPNKAVNAGDEVRFDAAAITISET
jgi:hypothetical protein